MLCSDEDRKGFDEFLRLRVEDVWRRESQREKGVFFIIIIIKIVYWVATMLPNVYSYPMMKP
jgi:hypothetical protein